MEQVSSLGRGEALDSQVKHPADFPLRYSQVDGLSLLAEGHRSDGVFSPLNLGRTGVSPTVVCNGGRCRS